MALYNISDLTSSSDVGSLVTFANTASNEILFGFFIIAFFVIMLLALKRYDFDDSLLVSSFLAFLVSAVAAYGGFLNLLFPLAFLILLALTGFYVWVAKR